MRNKESLTNTELTMLTKMPPLASKVKPTTAKVAELPRKKMVTKVSIHVKSEAAKQVSTDMESELAQPVSIDAKSDDAKSELVKPKLTREEREANVRAEAKDAVERRMLAAYHKAMADDWPALDAERLIIIEEEEEELGKKLAALDQEYQQCAEVCYMQQEMLEGKDDQDDRVYYHRFKLLTPGILGVFKPSGPCNRDNVDNLALLLRSLNQYMVAEGEDTEDMDMGYACKFCFRSLYLRKSRRERALCACLRCVSVLYCCPTCRDVDAKGHRISCFLHPAWECEERTKRRVEEMEATGIRAQPLVEQKAPAIVSVLDPREDSRVDPDPAAQLLAEQQQQDDGNGDEDNIVGDSADEDAKPEGGPDEDTATAKTADVSGDTDVDITE
jgi:hypothetical protein